jgi:hypothetical protein
MTEKREEMIEVGPNTEQIRQFQFKIRQYPLLLPLGFTVHGSPFTFNLEFHASLHCSAFPLG